MKDPQTFEQQLSALAPAQIETDASTAMYRCGFAAGQASHSASSSRLRPAWLQLVAAACLTAVLVGPVSYRLGHSRDLVTVAEQSPAPEEPIVDEGVVAGPATPAPLGKPAEPADAPHKFASVPKPSTSSKPLSPLFGSWLIGIPTSPARVTELSPVSGMVLTSRPPSADTMAWLEQSRPEQVNSSFDASDEPSPQGRGSESNHYRLPPLPSRNSLDTWEPWTQS